MQEKLEALTDMAILALLFPVIPIAWVVYAILEYGDGAHSAIEVWYSYLDSWRFAIRTLKGK